jgi:hypothetical protein
VTGQCVQSSVRSAVLHGDEIDRPGDRLQHLIARNTSGSDAKAVAAQCGDRIEQELSIGWGFERQERDQPVRRRESRQEVLGSERRGGRKLDERYGVADQGGEPDFSEGVEQQPSFGLRRVGMRGGPTQRRRRLHEARVTRADLVAPDVETTREDRLATQEDVAHQHRASFLSSMSIGGSSERLLGTSSRIGTDFAATC